MLALSLSLNHVQKPKTALIDKFNNHSEKIKSFFADLHTQFILQPLIYVSDTIKVLIIISYLKRSAKVWAALILKSYWDELMKNYTLFTQELQEQFRDLNLHNILMKKLRHLQQIISVLAYTNDFENLVYQIQWPKIVWDNIFYYDLKNQVKNILIYSLVF